MFAGLSSIVRTALLALGLAAGATTLATAGPVAPGAAGKVVAPPSSAAPLLVQDNGNHWRRRNAWKGNGEWNDTRVHRREWRDGRRGEWRDRHRRGEWRRYHDNRRYHRRPTVYFDLDLAPRRYYVEPRRQYRANGLSRVHVNWCHNRYRSYRAWDNSFQPYHGPRQQCYSPYL